MLFVREGSLHQGHELFGSQLPEDHDTATGQEGGVELKRRVLGGRSDQDDVAGFHVREKRILLCLVEAVDLIDEQERSSPVHPPLLLGLLHDRFDLLDAGDDGAEGNEVGVGALGDDAGQRRFAGARWPPQNEGADPVLLDRRAERGVLTENLFLTQDFVEIPGAHPLGERRFGARGFFRRRREEISLVHQGSLL